MFFNVYYLCNVYVINKCCVVSVFGFKDRKIVLNFGKVVNIILIKIGIIKYFC